MPWGFVAAAGANLLGGMLSSNAQENAANTSANAQLQSARIAADAAKFRPVGITTRFGSSQFGISPEGYVTSAGYNVSPELKSIQDYLMGQAGSTADTQRLLSLGRGYLAQTPEEAAAQYITAQQGLLAPSREQQLAGITNRLYQTGRTGLATGGTKTGYGPGGVGLTASSPELAAYYNSIAAQDATLAANAQNAAQQRIQFGQGLLSSAYSPITIPLGVAGQIEQLGQTPLDIGAQLGGRSATAGQTQANALLTGGLSAAKTLQAATGTSPFGSALTGFGSNQQLTSGIGNWFSNLIGGSNPYANSAGWLSSAQSFDPNANYYDASGNMLGF